MYIYICVCVYKSEKEEGTRGAEFSEARSQPRKSLKYTHTRERRKKYSLTLCDPGNNNINNYARKSIAKRGPTFIKDKENMFCSMALFSSSSSFSQSFCEHACVCWRVCVHIFFFSSSFFSSFFFFFLLLSRLKSRRRRRINQSITTTTTLSLSEL